MSKVGCTRSNCVFSSPILQAGIIHKIQTEDKDGNKGATRRVDLKGCPFYGNHAKLRKIPEAAGFGGTHWYRVESTPPEGIH